MIGDLPNYIANRVHMKSTNLRGHESSSLISLDLRIKCRVKLQFCDYLEIPSTLSKKTFDHCMIE